MLHWLLCAAPQARNLNLTLTLTLALTLTLTQTLNTDANANPHPNPDPDPAMATLPTSQSPNANLSNCCLALLCNYTLDPASICTLIMKVTRRPIPACGIDPHSRLSS